MLSVPPAAISHNSKLTVFQIVATPLLQVQLLPHLVIVQWLALVTQLKPAVVQVVLISSGVVPQDHKPTLGLVNGVSLVVTRKSLSI